MASVSVFNKKLRTGGRGAGLQEWQKVGVGKQGKLGDHCERLRYRGPGHRRTENSPKPPGAIQAIGQTYSLQLAASHPCQHGRSWEASDAVMEARLYASKQAM